MSIGVLEYNGYQFGEHSHVHVAADFVYDDSDRTVVYHRYKITVEAIIAPSDGDSDTNQHMRQIRGLLSKAGGRLRLEQKGFGPSLDINGSRVRDVHFGPKPRMLSWNPIGHDQAAEVVWECETCIPVCDGGGAKFQGLSTFNYGVDYSINGKGFTTRTITGYIEIAQTRNGRRIPDTADAYRDRIVAQKPDNFEREQSWNLTPDKLRVEFTITDREIESPNPYPAGVVRITGNHGVSWTRRHRAYLGNTINVEIELAHDQPRVRAWEIFREIVRKRIDKPLQADRTVFLDQFQLNEELFGNSIRFSIAYRVQAEIAEFFNLSGAFESLGLDWNSWVRSMGTVQSNRGFAGMGHRPSEDRIVDLCDTGISLTSQPYNIAKVPPVSRSLVLCNKKPPPLRSWLEFDASLTNYDESNTYFETTLGSAEIENEAFNPGSPDAKLGTVDLEGIDTVISRSSPSMLFRWKGYAERAGYPVTIPHLLKLDGVTLKQVGQQHFLQKHMGKHFCVDKFAAAWNFLYQVEERPKKMKEKPVEDPAEKTA